LAHLFKALKFNVLTRVNIAWMAPIVKISRMEIRLLLSHRIDHSFQTAKLFLLREKD